MSKVFKLIPLLILIIGLILFIVSGGYRYFTFDALKQHHDALLQWRMAHPLIAALLFIVIYIIAVAFSFPGATILTMLSGFLFGIILGAVYVVVGATLGASIVFLAARYAFGDWLAKKTGRWLVRLEQGFQRDAFQYLLFLRLLPIFPFWLINIVPGLLNVRFSTFFMATLIGIMPGSAVYAAVGNGLSSVFARGQTPNLSIIFEPQIIIPLVLLALLSILPILYKRLKSRQRNTRED